MKINILGAGVMGKQLVALLQLFGHDVILWSRRAPKIVEPEIDRQRRILHRKLDVAGTLGGLNVVDRLNALESALTIEVLSEDLDVKRAVIGDLSFDPSIHGLLTNTSSIQPLHIHPAARGLHFFNPVFAVKMVELAGTRDALQPLQRELIGSLEQNGFDVIETQDNPGYVANYVLFREIGSVLRLIDAHGYPPEVIERVLKYLGRSTTALDIIDLVGVDVCHKILLNLVRVDSTFYLSPTLGEAVQAGVLGNKNGTSFRGFLRIQARQAPAR
jgi:3-hydroxyacyl-CoA dehydrogenase